MEDKVGKGAPSGSGKDVEVHDGGEGIVSSPEDGLRCQEGKLETSPEPSRL